MLLRNQILNFEVKKKSSVSLLDWKLIFILCEFYLFRQRNDNMELINSSDELICYS